MTSPRWIALSRAARVTAECLMLHDVKDIAALEAVRKLVLDMRALVRASDDNGVNALHAAAIYGKPVPLVCALIKEGVDPTAKNSNGQTPADVATESGHALQAKLLQRAAEDAYKRRAAATVAAITTAT